MSLPLNKGLLDSLYKRGVVKGKMHSIELPYFLVKYNFGT